MERDLPEDKREGSNAERVTPASRAVPKKNHVTRFSRDGAGREYLVAVTGSMWQLYGMYTVGMHGAHHRGTFQ